MAKSKNGLTGHMSPRNALGVIGLFVGIVELAFAYPVTVLSGHAQTMFVVFMVCFPIVVFAGFLFILIRHPENLYSPADFQDPQVFAQLVVRRDKAVEDKLKATTAKLTDLTETVKAALRGNSDTLAALSAKIQALPELDRDGLELDMARIGELLQEVNRVLSCYLERLLESYCQHAIAGVDKVWIDTTSLGSTWSLDFLIIVATEAIRNFTTDQAVGDSKTGTIELRDGDFMHCFSYEMQRRSGDKVGTLTIKLIHSYALTA